MSSDFNFDKLLTSLASDDPEILIGSLDESVEMVERIAAAAVPQIKHPQMGLFVAERLFRVIDVVVKETETFFATATAGEAKVNAAVLLLMAGSKVGVPYLLEALEQDGSSPVWIANKLVNAGVVEAQEALIRRLHRTDVQDIRLIEGLLSALKRSGGQLPLELEYRFRNGDAPEELRDFMQEEWPPPPLPPPSIAPSELLRA